MARMADPGRFDHLRHSALELLDAGNSVGSVAQVLGVPASLLARWRTEPAPEGIAAVDAIAAQRSLTGAIHFRTTLALTKPMAVRAWHYVMVVLAGGDLIEQVVTGSRHPWLTIFNLSLVLVGVGVIVTHLGLSRTLLTLGPNAAIVPGLLGRRSMAYSELSDYWLVSVVRGHGDDEIEGRLLTLHSRRAGVRPIEVFIDDSLAVDPALIERLDEVKAANQGVQPLTPIRSIRKA